MTPTSGLINARNARPARPPPSPKSFVWPAKQAFTQELREQFAASLQELLARRKETHVDLGKALWGVTKIGACRSTKARNWILAQGVAPDANEAAYVAELLDVPMTRLLQPESAFSARPAMYKPRGAAKHAQRVAPTTEGTAPKKKRTYTKKQKAVPESNGGGDHRWVLPADAPRPHLALETSPHRASWVRLTVSAELPLDVAMSLVQLIHENKPGPAGEILMPVVFASQVQPMLSGPTRPMLESSGPPAESPTT
jgi:hypothetical protein